MSVDRKASTEAYFPALDGLRVLAFFLVFMHHCAPADNVSPWLHRCCTWSWLGVDLFFVLSGFLITYLLLEERQDFGSISIKNFYARRALRIWPVYFSVLACATIFMLANANWTRMDVFWRYLQEFLLPLWLFAGNYALIFNFGALIHCLHVWRLPEIHVATIFLPLWSLCIEEQFYALWPLVLLCVTGKRTLYLTGSAAVLASICSVPFLRQQALSSGHGWTYVYYNTPTHAGVIMLGALIAIAEVNRRGWAVKLLAGWRGASVGAAIVIGFAAICTWAIPLQECRHSADWLLPLIYFGCAVLLMLALYWQPLGTLLSQKALRRLSKLTYAMYVFHFFILDVSKSWIPAGIFIDPTASWAAQMVLGAVLTIAAAQLSWTLLESRMLALRKHFRRERPSVPVPAPDRELVSSALLPR